MPLKDLLGLCLNPASLAIIEIDIQIEHSERHANLFEEYVLPKIKRLLDFGTLRFFWIFSKSQTVLVANRSRKI